MQVESAVHITTPEDAPSLCILEKFVFIRGKLTVVTTSYDSKANQTLIYAQQFDLDGEPFAEATEIGAIPFMVLNNAGDLRFSLSPDSSVMLFSFVSNKEIATFPSYTRKVYNEELVLIWEKNTLSTYEDKNFSITDLAVDNDGNVFGLYQILIDKKDSKRDPKSSHYYLLQSFTESGNVIRELELKIPEGYISRLRIKCTPSDQILCYGFFSKLSPYSTGGVVLFEIDPLTTEMINSCHSELSPADLFKFKGNDQYKDGELKSSLHSLNLYRLKNGNSLLIAELGLDERWSVIFSANDLMVIHLDSLNKILWVNRIPKQQYGGPNVVSYKLDIGENKHRFYFNDDPADTSLEVEKPKEISFLKDVNFSEVIVDSEGNMKKNTIIPGNLKNIVSPKIAYRISVNEFVFLSYNTEKNDLFPRLIRITY